MEIDLSRMAETIANAGGVRVNALDDDADDESGGAAIFLPKEVL